MVELRYGQEIPEDTRPSAGENRLRVMIGGGSTIGDLAIVAGLKSGEAWAATYNSHEGLARLKSRLDENGLDDRQLHLTHLDLTRPDSVTEAAEEIRGMASRLGKDVLDLVFMAGGIENQRKIAFGSVALAQRLLSSDELSVGRIVVMSTSGLSASFRNPVKGARVKPHGALWGAWQKLRDYNTAKLMQLAGTYSAAKRSAASVVSVDPGTIPGRFFERLYGSKAGDLLEKLTKRNTKRAPSVAAKAVRFALSQTVPGGAVVKVTSGKNEPSRYVLKKEDRRVSDPELQLQVEDEVDKYMALS